MDDGRRFSRLIKPFADWQFWSDEAEQVHRISRSLLARKGRDGSQVARDLNQLLRGRQAYSDAWVVDKPWLETLFYRAGLAMEFHLSPIEALMADAQIEQWDLTKQRITQKLQLRRHRASTDALIIQQTFVDSYPKAG